METKETKDNMTLPFYKFEFLFMQWREIWKLNHIFLHCMNKNSKGGLSYSHMDIFKNIIF